MDRELLFKPRLAEDDVELEGVGTVRVRALNRLEAMRVKSVSDTAAQERLILVMGMVDPVINDDEAKRWQRASAAGELELVTGRIAVLSGMAPDSAKEAYKSLRDGSGAGVHVLPGAEAGDDSGPAASGDE